MYQSIESTGSLTFQRFSHKRIDDLFKNPIIADKGAKYAKRLFLNLSTLSPYVSGPNSVKIATPLEQYVTTPKFRRSLSCRLRFFVSYFAVRRVLQFYYLSTNGAADSEFKSGWQPRTLRSINHTSCPVQTAEPRILLLPPGSSRKPHLPRYLIQWSFTLRLLVCLSKQLRRM